MKIISHRQALAMLADELVEACGQIEALGAALCSDPALVRAHVQHLQSLDHVGQRCASVAEILRSDDIGDASRGAQLESIAARLTPHSRKDASRDCFDF